MTSLLIGIAVAVALLAFYVIGWLRGYRNGIKDQNDIAMKSYEQVLSVSTAEQKKRFDDQVNFERQLNDIRTHSTKFYTDGGRA